MKLNSFTCRALVAEHDILLEDPTMPSSRSTYYDPYGTDGLASTQVNKTKSNMSLM